MKLEIGSPLPAQFYLRSTPLVARSLLGKGLYVKHGKEELLVELTEVEAYLGSRDPASHAYRGPTPRNRAMFEAGGTAYVYLSYGMHYCLNVCTQPKGIGEAILFRSAAPLAGMAGMLRRRGLPQAALKPDYRNLLTGPGKLCQALGIDLGYNDLRFERPDFKLVDLGQSLRSAQIGASPRIGISKAAQDELRFYVKGSPHLSRRESA